MTNREWLNSLTDEEYAQEILDDLTCYINASARDICWKETCGYHKECLSCAIRWLKMQHNNN